MIWWQAERARVGNLARTPRNTLLFALSVMGSLMTTMSQGLSLTSHPKHGVSYTTVCEDW